MAEQLKNDAFTTLAADLTNVATTLTVADAPGAGYGLLSSSGDYTIRVWQGGSDDAPTSLELMRVTGVAGSVLTVTRGQGGTTATSFTTGAKVAQVLDSVSLAAYVTENAGSGLSGLTTDKVLVASGATTVITPSDLSWDNTNSRLGIGAGATAPTHSLQVAGTSPPAKFGRTDEAQAQVVGQAFGWATFHSFVFNTEKGGSGSSTAQVKEGADILSFNAAPADDTGAFGTCAGFALIAREDQTSTSRAGMIVFSTVPSGSTTNTPRLTIDHNGNVIVGQAKSYSNDFGSNVITVNSNPDNTKGTTDTGGWLWITTSAGAPTGVPADAPVGVSALHYDKTNDKIYVYNGGWKSTAALT